ncbi:hypothetical protein K2173_007752 [Erythroxylum novogranatense]|uniref:Uncharacterized protein n=1 Tax=Erythroxylum novogranatense TaxID=1862640 RepID=A0AAV8TD33_9ROSI|nr:hypothetical protein K2173_007752 [Erythroxylum novogranatense]
MVPFGKAAFFPGRLIHTNEFMVLLGEGYYAERTCKQTIEILKRRGKALDSQVESLQANLKDLRAEALFFNATSSESAEGLVEIREDYVDENGGQTGQKSGTEDEQVTVEDDEYAKEELAAEDESQSDEDEHANTVDSHDASEKEKQSGAGDSNSNIQTSSEMWELEHQLKQGYPTTRVLSNKDSNKPNLTEQLSSSGLEVGPIPKDENYATQNVVSLPHQKDLLLPKVGEEVKEVSLSRKEAFTGSILERSDEMPSNAQMQKQTLQTPLEASKPRFDSSKAFTGSIVERTTNVQTDPIAGSSKLSTAQPSRPVSRFKQQRR